MNKAQAIDKFWNGFGIPAYDQFTVPKKQKDKYPYITYSFESDGFEHQVTMNANLWYKTSSWADVFDKAEEISRTIEQMYPPTLEIDGGRLYITKGTPFAQRLDDPDDDTIRRMYLTVQVEYMTRW